tara:strand:- start:270 stop:962 length:693 start_codon:yes stop_codon:yes gene_type:complete
MEDFTKVRRKNASNQAIELLARNMNLNHQDIADKIGVSRPTIVSWMSHPEFIDAVYNRYMELAGTELPAVVQAMIEEAKLGNVNAAKLILEHFGKLESKLRIQIESNFEKFMKAEDIEDADFFEITTDQEDVFDAISEYAGSENIDVPDKHPSNNSPKIRDQYEKYRIKKKIKKSIAEQDEAKKQAERHQLRKRAKKVGLSLLSSGSQPKGKREEWLSELERLESEKNEN